MIYGLGAGIVWAAETLLLSFVLAAGIFEGSKEAIFLAPFVTAFFNDTFSCTYVFFYRKANKTLRRNNIFNALKTKRGKLLLLSGLCGGPLGMGSYLLAIKYIGASYTSVISALYPAIGSVIAWLFLRELLSKKQLAGLALCTLGTIGIVGLPGGFSGNPIYFLFAFSCALFWGLEAVISSQAMKDGNISSEDALQIRHLTSILCYGVIFLPLLGAWNFTLQIFLLPQTLVLFVVTALLETCSYLLYYKAISKIGAPKAMSLNVTYIVWAVLLGIFVLKEIPKAFVLVSMAVLLLGVLFVVTQANKHEEKSTV
ncbi:MAG: hypothetical protein K0S04_1925 [Herbinix sp.]|nr:hypothetical protein [Herbinix sp.]